MPLPMEEIVVPIIIFSAIISQYIYAILSGTYGPTLGRNPRNAIIFFKMMREGWVQQNHMTGQAAVNTTRDYIRVVVFLAGNAIVCASILAGIALNSTDVAGNSSQSLLMKCKLGGCVALLLVIFLFLLLCLRYILHFR